MAATSEQMRTQADYALLSDEARRTPSGRIGLRLLAALRSVIRRTTRFGDADAPAVPGSLVYEMCMEYAAQTLWNHYYAFRMNPCSDTWTKLRRQVVPWQRGVRVEQLLAEVLPHNGKHSPDGDVVKRALMNFSGAPSLSNSEDTRKTRAYRPRR